MDNSNRGSGARFEAALADTLADSGYWVHLLTQNKAGQPADLIAVRNGDAYLIDCKECKRGKFPLSRMESNQLSAMELWLSLGNGSGWFALKLSDGSVFMLPHTLLTSLAADGTASLSEEMIKKLGVVLDVWK